MILRKRRTSVSGQLQSTAAHILPPHLPLQLASWMTSLEKSIHKSSMKVKRKRGGVDREERGHGGEKDVQEPEDDAHEPADSHDERTENPDYVGRCCMKSPPSLLLL